MSTVPQTTTATPRKGRILRVKQGANPNSSSVGSDVPTFLALAASASAIAMFLMHIFDRAGKTIDEQMSEAEPTDSAKATPAAPDES